MDEDVAGIGAALLGCSIFFISIGIGGVVWGGWGALIGLGAGVPISWIATEVAFRILRRI